MVAPPSAPIRVLITDDQENFRRATAAFVTAVGGFQVVGEAGTGEEAVGMVGPLDAQLVVMDVRLPGIDGVEATRLLREAAPRLPIVAISGHDYEERVLEIREAGASDYVRKSRVEDDLVLALEALVASSVQQR